MASCARCWAEFTAQRSTARYCSAACRAAAYRELERFADDNGTCWGPGCDATVWQYERTDKQYCSPACRQRAYRDRRKSPAVRAPTADRPLAELLEALACAGLTRRG